MISGNRGQSIVEFALVLPILLLLLVAIMEFGFAFNLKITLVHIAREGVRFGVIEARTDQQIRDRVKMAAAHLGLTDEQITLSKDTNNKTLKVSVQSDFTVMDPITITIIGPKIPMSAYAIMSLE